MSTAYEDLVRDRALETIARIEMTPEARAEADARASANKIDRIMAERVTWDPANPRRLTVATMSVAEYSAYCDAGQPPLPDGSEKRTGAAASAEYATKKWVNGQVDVLVKSIGTYLPKKYVRRKDLDPLVAEVEQASKQCRSLRTDMTELQRVNEARGDIIDQLSRELGELKRERALEKRLADQNVKRRVDLLEMENSLLRAGRRPDDARDEAEAEIPKFLENGHAR